MILMGGSQSNDRSATQIANLEIPADYIDSLRAALRQEPVSREAIAGIVHRRSGINMELDRMRAETIVAYLVRDMRDSTDGTGARILSDSAVAFVGTRKDWVKDRWTGFFSIFKLLDLNSPKAAEILEVAQRIFVNNPQLREPDYSQLRQHIRSELYPSDNLIPNLREDVCIEYAKLLGAIGGKRSYEALNLLVDAGKAVTQVIEELEKRGIESLKKRGIGEVEHSLPILAKVERTYSKSVCVQDAAIVERARTAIVNLLATVSERPAYKPRELRKKLADALGRHEKPGRWSRCCIALSLMWNKPTNTRELTKIAIGKMKSSREGVRARWTNVLSATQRIGAF